MLGSLSIVGGGFEIAAGGTIAAGTSVTGIGAAGGTMLMVHGFGTVSFGIVEVTMGFAEKKEEIPSGLTEVAGIAGEKLTGVKGIKKAGKIIDQGIQVASGGSPARKTKNIYELVPSSAKEAAKLGDMKLKILREVIDLSSQVSSATQIAQTVNEITNKNVENKTDEKK